MSQENVDALRQAYSAYNNQLSTEAIRRLVAEFCEPDVEWWPIQEPAPQRGRESVVRAIEGWFEAWEDLRIDPEDFVPWAGGVVVPIRITGRGKGSGVPMQERFCHFFEMRDGKVRRFREYQSRQEALEAAGLSE